MPGDINNRQTIESLEKYSKLTMETLKRRQWRFSGGFIVNFQYMLQF